MQIRNGFGFQVHCIGHYTLELSLICEAQPLQYRGRWRGNPSSLLPNPPFLMVVHAQVSVGLLCLCAEQLQPLWPEERAGDSEDEFDKLKVNRT